MRLIDADDIRMPNDLPYKASVKRVLMMAPTIDAVEVVRCKDCKDWIRHSGHASYSPTGACFIWAETTLGEDFCSNGERKET